MSSFCHRDPFKGTFDVGNALSKQRDRMILWKKRPKCSPPQFLRQKLCRRNSILKTVIPVFYKMSTVNDHPKRRKFSNQVTLEATGAKTGQRSRSSSFCLAQQHFLTC
jgi:hypothetical protein